MNGAVATSTANVSSTQPCFEGAYWTGSSSTQGGACIQLIPASGTNPTASLYFNPVNLSGNNPNYIFNGNSLSFADNSSGSTAWVTYNNGISEQVGDARLDVNNIGTPTSWFDVGGTPTAERTVTLPDATGQVIETGTGGGVASGQTLNVLGTINMASATVPGFSVGNNEANYLIFSGAATNNPPTIQSYGNAGLILEANGGSLNFFVDGTGEAFVDSSGNIQSHGTLYAGTVGNLNNIAISPAASGSTPSISTGNSPDTNVSLNLQSKGTGTVQANGLTVATQGSNGLSAGTITISSATSGSHTFTTAYTSAPICVASENSSTPTALTFGVTSSTTTVTVTLSASGSGTFTWQCFPAEN